MSGYVCKKKITLSGNEYVPGELIPAEAVLPSRALSLMRSNYIVAATDPEAADVIAKAEEAASASEGDNSSQRDEKGDNLINLPIHTSEGILTATVSPQAVSTAFTILQLSEKEAKEVIKATEDDDALMLVNAIERRKGVGSAVAERHEQLTGSEDGKAGDADVEDV